VSNTDTHPALRPLGVGSGVAGRPVVQGVGARAGDPRVLRPDGAPVQGGAFGQQLARVQAQGQTPPSAPSNAGDPVPRPREVVVQRGDTLSSIVKAQWSAQGQRAEALSAGQAHRWALQVARDNGLANPDFIQVGQKLNIALPANPAAASTAQVPKAAQPAPPVLVAALSTVPSVPNAAREVQPLASILKVPEPVVSASAHPLLNQTLDRAVDLGFIPSLERQQVQSRIAELADKHGFKPDDFAKAVLMESDGLNPRATNGRCHGIIQFCAGPDRGAASAGYGQRPQEILNLSVLRQLDLVDRYFDDTRLKDFRGRDGQVRLDDLYLTILTPAARQERRLSVALPIAGPQALDLHTRRDRQLPITRSSILAGLHANARNRLSSFTVASLGSE
jgi:hypothetical protein